MKNLRMRGGAAAAIVASAAMVLSTIAIAPAYAVDSVCPASNEDQFNGCLAGNNSTIKISGNDDGVLGFGIQNATLTVGSTFVGKRATGYGEVVTKTVPHSVTITSDNPVVMRNIQFIVPTGVELTFAGSVILDDVDLNGVALGSLVAFGGSDNPTGVSYGVRVAGGTFTMKDSSVIAVGTNVRTLSTNRAIEVVDNNSTVNLESHGTYPRSEQEGLARVRVATLIPFIGDVLDAVVDPILGILSFNRNGDYPTVWGRDAAVYSEPNVTNAQINITAGSYLNKKDREPINETTLNGAISTSATVNITGEEGVRISNLKLGNGVDSSHNGTTVEGKLTGGTLNLNNANAQIDPSVETDKNVTAASTDSWALELRGNAVANVVAGKIADGKHSPKKVIESEQNAKVNILAAKQGDVTIGSDTGDRQYYIQGPQRNGNEFTADVNPAATAEASADENEYNLWLGGAAAGDSTLNTLSNLVNDSARKKLDTSYASDGTSMNAYAAPSAGQSVYGRKVVATGTSESPFGGVNGGTAGTVTLYGAPYTADSKSDLTAPTAAGKLFAGWYTSESAYGDENTIQGTDYSDAYVTKVCASGLMNQQLANKRHHCWDNGATYYPNADTVGDAKGTDPRIVVSKSYSGSLYPHFVGSDTIKVTGQTASARKGDGYRNVRLLAGLDSYNFKGVTFTVTLGKATKSMSTSTAYDYVTEDGVKKAFALNPAFKADVYTAKTAQNEARYLATGVISNVPFGTTFTVVPKWTTLDGTVVTGAAQTVTLGANGKLTIN